MPHCVLYEIYTHYYSNLGEKKILYKIVMYHNKFTHKLKKRTQFEYKVASHHQKLVFPVVIRSP